LYFIAFFEVLEHFQIHARKNDPRFSVTASCFSWHSGNIAKDTELSGFFLAEIILKVILCGQRFSWTIQNFPPVFKDSSRICTPNLSSNGAPPAQNRQEKKIAPNQHIFIILYIFYLIGNPKKMSKFLIPKKFA
jgi:hypothetical protein